MNRFLPLLALFALACSGSAPSVGYGPAEARSEGSPSVDVGGSQEQRPGAVVDAGSRAPDSGSPSTTADAASTPGSDASTTPDAPDSPDVQVDPCAAVVQGARANGLECGMYQGCDLGTCAPVGTSPPTCGGGLPTAANLCSNHCIDRLDVAGSACAKLASQFTASWAVFGGCQVAYRDVGGQVTWRSGGVTGCVGSSDPSTDQVFQCCP